LVKKYLLALLICVFISMLPGARKALVIGNSNYPDMPLRTPVNDAEDIKSVLESLDFSVQLVTNASQGQMLRAVSDFSEHLSPEDEVVFYYAGHGIQIGGQNYLIPTSPQILDEYDAVAYSYNLNLLLDKISKPKVAIFFLDACRNNPYAWTRSMPSGLAGVETSSSSQYVICSTRAGSVALDGKGRNSPFAEAIMRNICEPMPVEDFIRKVSSYMEQATDDRQTPSTAGNLRISYSIAKMPEMRSTQVTQAPEMQTVPNVPTPKPVPSPVVKDPGPGKNWGDITVCANVDGDIYLNDSSQPAAHIMQNTRVPLRKLNAGHYKLIFKSSVGEQTREIELPANQEIDVQFTFATTHIPTGFKLVPGGSFDMGSEAADEKPVHRVELSPFYMSIFELTVGEFKQFVDATGYVTTAERKGYAWALIPGNKDLTKLKGASWRNPNFETTDRFPVCCVSWFDAIAYCNWRSQQEGLTPYYNQSGYYNPADWSKGIVQYNVDANGYRLPTEAEWEYAARANNNMNRFSGDDIIARVAIHFFNSQDRAWEVASKAANDFGIYDLTGNVSEWVWDWYESNYYKKSPGTNPLGPFAVGKRKVIRGGSWYDDEKSCCVSYRMNQEPDFAESGVGFRLVKKAE